MDIETLLSLTLYYVLYSARFGGTAPISQVTFKQAKYRSSPQTKPQTAKHRNTASKTPKGSLKKQLPKQQHIEQNKQSLKQNKQSLEQNKQRLRHIYVKDIYMCQR